MKNKISLMFLFNLWVIGTSAQCDTWTQKADLGGVTRHRAVGFSIGDKGYIGTGQEGSTELKGDFWEYDPGTNTWSQKADFGGTARYGAVGFSIGSKGYIGTGYDGTYRRDFWEYDVATNMWTQKADMIGQVRWRAVGFSIGGKGYIGTGDDAMANNKADFREYDPVNDVWTTKANFGGTGRWGAVGFSIGSKGYIGTGYRGGLSPYKKDFWEYDPSTNTWTQKADFGGNERRDAVGFSLGRRGYIGTGWDGTSRYKDFWEYDTISNTWAQKSDFGGTPRTEAVGFSIFGSGYIGTGWDPFTKKDFWEYISGPSITSVVKTDMNCFNGIKGSAVVVVNSCLPYTILWSTGDTSDTASGLTVGSYSVTVTDSSGYIAAQIISINGASPFFTLITTDSASCYGAINGSAALSVFGGTGPYVYSWSDSSFSDSLQGLAAGTYWVSVTDTNNCTTFDSVYISEPQLVVTDIPAEICIGDSVSFAGNYYSIQGTFYDSLFGVNGCDSIVTLNLTLTGVDTSVTDSVNSLIANASGATFQWLDCDSNFNTISAATNPVLTPMSSGNYAVEVTINGCADTSSCHGVFIIGIGESFADNDIVVYPNPADGIFTVEHQTGKVRYEITDVAGKLIATGTLTGEKTTIDLSKFKRGIYLLKTGNHTVELIKL